MALPSNGNAISFSQINTELGVGSSTQRSLNDSVVRTLFAVASGQISMSQGWGRSNCPTNGTFSTSFCSGYTLYYRYHNGSCGTYDSVYQYNSATCGYVAPSQYCYTLACSGDAWLCTGCGDDDDSAGGLQSYKCCSSYTWACCGSYGGGDLGCCTIYLGSGGAYSSNYGSWTVCSCAGRCSGGCI
jgi:hypothetical protein